MPRRLPKTTIRRIRDLREKGWRTGQIAEELRVHRKTVAKYVKPIDDAAETEGQYEGLLSPAELESLKTLVGLVRWFTCTCGEQVPLLTNCAASLCTNCDRVLIHARHRTQMKEQLARPN